MKRKIRKLSDTDWNQLLSLCSGYLPLVNGDVKAAMSKALAAHAELIEALKAESIEAVVPDGRVTMTVAEEGGVAIRLDTGNSG